MVSLEPSWLVQLERHRFEPAYVASCVHEAFALVAQRAPDAVAVLSPLGRLTYSELLAESQAFARELIVRGVTPGASVAICAERTPSVLVALLGILAAGAAYVPIASNYPPERVAFILDDASVRLVVTDRASRSILPGAHPELLLDERTWTRAANDAPLPRVTSEAPAYVMYTSGSTGRPKGVVVPHRAIERLTNNPNCVPLGPGTVFLHAAPLAFDASTIEIWGPLLTGGAVALFDEPIPTANALGASISRFGVTTAWLTAALFNLIVDQDASRLAGLTHLVTGGEALSVEHVRRAQRALPGTQLVNGYGPTECTTFATCFPIPRPVPDDWTAIPIGTAIRQTTLYVVKESGEPAALGEEGELWIGGDGVALEYLRQPELTARSFVPDPLDSARRVYRTGDLVRFSERGYVEYVGRADRQVKIRGFRIELGEIEAAIAQLDGIASVAVTVRPTSAGDKRLVGYFVPRECGAVTSAQIAEALAARLPDYMVPQSWVELGELPLTDNGKLDQRALPAPSSARPDLPTTYRKPTTPRERSIVDVWESLLEVEPVGTNDNFFDLGGTSLLAVRAAAAIERVCGVTLPAVRLFEKPTVARLAAHLDGAREDGLFRLVARADERAVASRAAPGLGAPIAIIGMAGRFPGASSYEALWQMLVRGEEGISFFDDAELSSLVPRVLRSDPSYVRARGVIDDYAEFDASFFGVSRAEAELMDPQQRVLLELSWSALEDGGYFPGGTPDVIGVFAGKYNDTYFSELVTRAPASIDRFGAFNTMLANEKDYVATRVAHALDLTGPALSIHTACSTSLVCIVQAVAALRAGQCDLALAGAAAITVPVESGYLHQEGTMLSPDGHTRTFSDRAGGTVFSDGAAMVLLKRLDQAIADRDHVYAVVRGAALNNDGRHKASFTAPSVDAQATVIALAQRDAGVTADDIDYVEAHGTATHLGDPVEVEALTKAFRLSTERKRYCALGSLKSNIGHTVTAAGVAGVIKTALALEREQIPKTLHFERPNPSIDFDSSPFVVAAEQRAWPRGARRRLAGVSSFGVGGTNAHVVIEEAPPTSPRPRQRAPELVLLSGRTASALERATAQLGGFLRERSELHLRDVAFTLHRGRAAFSERRALVARDASDLLDQLELTAPTASPPASQARPVFLFPGQGSQFHKMGARLYARYAEFRAHFDLCDRELEPLLGCSLRQVLFEGDADAGNALLRDTALTQPALFAIEYSLARLLMSFGIEPHAMAGHSVGEFVAATLAGVMSLPHALLLVARRGALMGAQPPGSMLGVRKSAAEIEPLLPPELSIAAENAPSLCVVAGPTDAVEAFHAVLEREGIAARALVTSHAFHSAMMDPVLEPFRELVRSVALSPPRTRFVSTTTGTWITDEQATDPEYWALHLRRPVVFSGALQTLLSEENLVFVEVGPRNVLTTLLFQHRSERKPVGFPTLGSDDETSESALLSALGRLWELGFELDETVHGDPSEARRVPLPTYPFARDRHWLDVERTDSLAQVASAPASPRAPVASEQVAVPAFDPRDGRRALIESQLAIIQRQLDLIGQRRG